MKKIVSGIAVALLMQAGVVLGADDAYLGLKAGIFLPNGKALSPDLKSSGLSNVNTGYNVDVTLGFKPATYAAVELGTGFFTASGDVSDTSASSSITAYGIPVTLTAKGVLHRDRLDLFAGAGAGYYFCFINNKINFVNNTRPGVDESAHGGALGYHATAGADYAINKQVSVGAEFKWFSTKPEIEVTSAAGSTAGQKIKPKWEFGGTVLNAAVKYRF